MLLSYSRKDAPDANSMCTKDAPASKLILKDAPDSNFMVVKDAPHFDIKWRKMRQISADKQKMRLTFFKRKDAPVYQEKDVPTFKGQVWKLDWMNIYDLLVL